MNNAEALEHFHTMTDAQLFDVLCCALGASIECDLTGEEVDLARKYPGEVVKAWRPRLFGRHVFITISVDESEIGEC